MFFSYTMSVILLSLSMYGIWCFFHDCWKWWLEPHLVNVPSSSFLIVVRNMDGEIEDLFRYLAGKIEDSSIDCDIVVADVSSSDFTSGILERLAYDIDILTVITIPSGQRAIGESIALCRGKVVHVLDLSHRMNSEEFMVMVNTLLRPDQQEIVVRRVSK